MSYRLNLDNIGTAWGGHRDFANWLVEYVKPEVTVELGVDWGFSLFSFAEPRIGQVYGIDLFIGDEHAGGRDAEVQYGSVKAFITDNGLDHVHILKQDFNEAADEWLHAIDILHIDGLHTYDAVKNDFYRWSPFMKTDGVILMHDVAAWPDVHRFYNELELPKAYFEHSAGLGVLCKNSELLDKILESWNSAHCGNRA